MVSHCDGRILDLLVQCTVETGRQAGTLVAQNLSKDGSFLQKRPLREREKNMSPLDRDSIDLTWNNSMRH